MASMICRVLFKSLVFCALSFALDRAGNSSDARIAMMAMTTSNSMSVKARLRVFICSSVLIRFVSASLWPRHPIATWEFHFLPVALSCSQLTSRLFGVGLGGKTAR
jgi:hypothetical protein